MRPAARSTAERNALVSANLGLAWEVTLRLYRSQPLLRSQGTEDDLFQNACIWLLRAAECWDEARGIRFSTYAWTTMCNRLMRQVYEGNLIHVPNCQIPALRGQVAGNDWTEQARAAVRLRGTPGNPTCVDNDYLTTDDRNRLEQLERLRAALAKLSSADRDLLTRRYGLFGTPAARARILAAEAGIIPDAVRMRLGKARRRLARAFTALTREEDAHAHSARPAVAA